MSNEKLNKAFEAFDQYNSQDPHRENLDGKDEPKELVYAKRMTSCLNNYSPDAPEYLQLAARCQHIGRWEIPRDSFPMDRKGYLQWRSVEKLHHVKIATPILTQCGYESETIEKVKALLLKKELFRDADTQILEDVICLVFVEHYLNDFAAQHEDDKVVNILKKTLKKMSSRAVEEIAKLNMTEKFKTLIAKATAHSN